MVAFSLGNFLSPRVVTGIAAMSGALFVDRLGRAVWR